MPNTFSVACVFRLSACAHQSFGACAVVMAFALGALALRAFSADTMPVNDVKAGMKAKGRTVFRGTKIEQFDVDILGVLDNAEPGRKVILARVISPELKDGPVIAGMSGSPVYVKGKLIGAVAYTWAFSKDGLCGITPIGEMLADAEQGRRTQKAPIIAGSPSLTGGAGAVAATSAPGALCRIQTPVMVAGWSPRMMEALRPSLEQYGLVPVQSGGAASVPSSLRPLEPGSAVGVQLVGGDMDLSAVGTVTYCEGDRVLAFGHPLLNEGTISAPMTRAYVHAIVPSIYSSFKLAGGMDPVGSFIYDRGAVVEGKKGATCDIVPCDVTIRKKDTGDVSQYRYTLLRHRDLTPILAEIVLASSYYRTEPDRVEVMGSLQATIKIKGRKEPWTYETRFFDDGMMYWILGGAAWDIGMLARNPYCSAEIEQASFNVELVNGRRTAEIQYVRVDKESVEPGKTLWLTVGLRPYRCEKAIEKKVEVRIPEDIARGASLDIVACDADGAEGFKRQQWPGLYQVENLDQLISLTKQVERENSLIVCASLPRTGVTYRGQGLPDLPASIEHVMSGAIQTGTGHIEDAIIQRVSTDWILSGRQSIRVTVGSDNATSAPSP